MRSALLRDHGFSINGPSLPAKHGLGDIARCGAQMNDRSSSRCEQAKDVHMRHHVVPTLLFFCSRLLHLLVIEDLETASILSVAHKLKKT